jgi:hypothetical protein
MRGGSTQERRGSVAHDHRSGRFGWPPRPRPDGASVIRAGVVSCGVGTAFEHLLLSKVLGMAGIRLQIRPLFLS